MQKALLLLRLTPVRHVVWFGLVWCWQVTSNRDTWLLVNNVEVARMFDLGDSGSCGGNGYAWVSAGDVISIRGTAPAILRFYPMKA